MNKKLKRQLKSQELSISTSPQIKVSELIGEFASDYINMGKTIEERQKYLNGACTAWNIAGFPEHSREGVLRHVITAYKRMNPGLNDADNLEQALRVLIQRKLEIFPDIKKIIIDATIEPIKGMKYRINITSVDNIESLEEVFKKKGTL